MVVMVMVMVSMCFGAFAFANGCRSTVTIIVALPIFIFRLPTFPSRFRGDLARRFLMGSLDIIAPKVRVRKRDLGARRPWARDANTAYATPDTRKHATKFALDSRFPRWPL